MASYTLGIAFLNSRTTPTMVRGSWDFVGIVLALSGFILLGGPLLLGSIDSLWRAVMVRGNLVQLRNAWRESGTLWISMWGGYFFFVVGFVVWGLMVRRNVTVIYNLDPAVLAETLEELLERLGKSCKVQPNGLVVIPDGFLLEIVPQQWLRHATLRWNEAQPLSRLAIENELQKVIFRVGTPINPSANWILSAASCLFFLLLFCLVFMISFLFLTP